MEITEVKVHPVKGNNKLKAYATVVFDNSFIVRDLKIIEGNDGYFISMPSRRTKDGSFRDIAHPLNTDMRTALEEAIINKYKEEFESSAEDSVESFSMMQ